ncbi:MAG: tetratricopeptide repeat protein, partial [Bacteroidales bacterium]
MFKTSRKYIYSITLLLFSVLFLLQGCSTRKNTWTRRTYHNVRAKYNTYWNGNQAFKEGLRQIRDAHQDNFNQILPVFRLADEAAAQNATPQMNRAIEKSAKVIQQHSMEFNGIEHNNWIDNAYLLMGKSQFYKQEYMLSMRLFNFIISKYHRRNLIYDAMVWKSRVDIMRGNYEQALNLLEEVRFFDNRKGKVSKEAQRMYPRVFAQLYIDMEQYDKAIEWLDKAAKASKNKDIRNRMLFIKAQVYQEAGKPAQAAEAYRHVSKKNPSYEISFYSRINLARVYQAGEDKYNI